MFQEQIQTPVFSDLAADEEQEGVLTIRYDGDVLWFVVDDKPVFSGDWTGNFAPLFERILQMWEPFREDR